MIDYPDFVGTAVVGLGDEVDLQPAGGIFHAPPHTLSMISERISIMSGALL